MAVNPIIKRAIERAYRFGHAELPSKSVKEVRNYYFAQDIKQLKNQHFETIEVKQGVFIRIHRAKHLKKNSPTVLYLRASGYVLGNIEQSSMVCHHLAHYLNCHVIALEPRLSPEAKFPEPFDDCIAGIQYLIENHQTLNINIRQFCLWGESSGGNLSAALSQYFKNDSTVHISHQILFYPMLDYARAFHYPSKKNFAKGYLMENDLSDWFLNQYVRDKTDFEDERVSPLLAQSFTSLPKSLVIGAQYDPMRDEASAYVNRLARESVPVHSLFMPGLIHGFMWYYDKVDSVRYAVKVAAKYLNEAVF